MQRVLVENKRRPLAVVGKRVYVGRPSKWGNRFVIGRDGSRKEVIEKYEAELTDELVRELEETGVEILVCWCAPLGCHADVLAKRVMLLRNRKGE